MGDSNRRRRRRSDSRDRSERDDRSRFINPSNPSSRNNSSSSRHRRSDYDRDHSEKDSTKWQRNSRNNEDFRRRENLEQTSSRTGMDPEQYRLFEKVRQYAPYLTKLKNQIIKSGKERERAEEMEDIDFWIEVSRDINSDSSLGLVGLRNCLSGIMEMARRNPIVEPETAVVDVYSSDSEEDSRDEYENRSTATAADSTTTAGESPEGHGGIETDWNYNPNNPPPEKDYYKDYKRGDQEGRHKSGDLPSDEKIVFVKGQSSFPPRYQPPRKPKPASKVYNPFENCDELSDDDNFEPPSSPTYSEGHPDAEDPADNVFEMGHEDNPQSPSDTGQPSFQSSNAQQQFNNVSEFPPEVEFRRPDPRHQRQLSSDSQNPHSRTFQVLNPQMYHNSHPNAIEHRNIANIASPQQPVFDPHNASNSFLGSRRPSDSFNPESPRQPHSAGDNHFQNQSFSGGPRIAQQGDPRNVQPISGDPRNAQAFSVDPRQPQPFPSDLRHAHISFNDPRAPQQLAPDDPRAPQQRAPGDPRASQQPYPIDPRHTPQRNAAINPNGISNHEAMFPSQLQTSPDPSAIHQLVSGLQLNAQQQDMLARMSNLPMINSQQQFLPNNLNNIPTFQQVQQQMLNSTNAPTYPQNIPRQLYPGQPIPVSNLPLHNATPQQIPSFPSPQQQADLQKVQEARKAAEEAELMKKIQEKVKERFGARKNRPPIPFPHRIKKRVEPTDAATPERQPISSFHRHAPNPNNNQREPPPRADHRPPEQGTQPPVQSSSQTQNKNKAMEERPLIATNQIIAKPRPGMRPPMSRQQSATSNSSKNNIKNSEGNLSSSRNDTRETLESVRQRVSDKLGTETQAKKKMSKLEELRKDAVKSLPPASSNRNPEAKNSAATKAVKKPQSKTKSDNNKQGPSKRRRIIESSESEDWDNVEEGKDDSPEPTTSKKSLKVTQIRSAVTEETRSQQKSVSLASETNKSNPSQTNSTGSNAGAKDLSSSSAQPLPPSSSGDGIVAVTVTHASASGSVDQTQTIPPKQPLGKQFQKKTGNRELDGLHGYLREMNFDAIMPTGPRRGAAKAVSLNESTTAVIPPEPVDHISETLDAVIQGSRQTTSPPTARKKGKPGPKPKGSPTKKSSPSPSPKKGKRGRPKKLKKKDKKLKRKKKKKPPIVVPIPIIKTEVDSSDPVVNQDGINNEGEQFLRTKFNTKECGIIIGRHDIIVNPSLTKIKVESDYIPPTGIKPEPIEVSYTEEMDYEEANGNFASTNNSEEKDPLSGLDEEPIADEDIDLSAPKSPVEIKFNPHIFEEQLS